MPATAEQLERTSSLKRRLIKFAQTGRLEREFRRAFAEQPMDTDADAVRFTDRFVLQHRLKDGRTVVEHFVGSHPELSEEDKALVLGWRDVIEDIFEIEGRDGEALVAVSLTDELTYRIRSNMGPSVFDQMPERSFLSIRIVPVADEWLISGVVQPIPASMRPEVLRAVVRTFPANKAAVFRNQEKLELGWQLQREDRECFLSFFGTDEVVMTGAEFSARMPEYWDYRMSKARAKAEERGANRAALNAAAKFDLPDNLCDAESVGVIYDEVEGLLMLDGFATVQAVFDDPALALDRAHRQRLRSYLNDDTVPPVVLDRLADRDLAKTDQVFRRLLNRPGFSWEQDGEALLRRHKREHFERPTYPSVTPVSDRFTKYLLE